MRKRVFKKVAVVAITIVACLSTATTAFALYYPKAYYDKISWNYEYSGPYTNSYNCLGYATGSMKWEWPWRQSNPTNAQVTAYLKEKGYYVSDKYPHIISYGTSSNITHFR